MASGTTLYEHILGEGTFGKLVEFFQSDPITQSTFAKGDAVIGASAVLGTWSICFVLLGLAFLARTKLNASLSKKGTDVYLADDGFSIKNIL